MSIRAFQKHLSRIILIFNVAAMLLVWICCASTWIEPATHPQIATMGLFFPIFVLAEVTFVAVWLFVRPRWSWIPIAGLLPCAGFLMDYCPISLNEETPKNCLKIITWNTDGFGAHEENKDSAKTLAVEYLEKCDADIICLQESNIWEGALTDFYNYMDSAGYKRDEYIGLTLLTRLPIIDSDSILYDTYKENGVKGNGSIWYRLKYGNDTILLVNNHLESNHLVAQVKDEYRESLEESEYDKLKTSGDTISKRLFSSVTYRGPQADSLACFFERNKGQRIIACGDFNDTPISYTYQRISHQLSNVYRKSGNGIGVSYNQKGFWVRIDHIFVSDQWKTYNAFIDKSIKASDHYPLVSWLKME